MESDSTKKIDISVTIHDKDLITKASLLPAPQDNNNEKEVYVFM